MNSMLTLALVVVGCSVIVMFSQEFGNFFKKIMAISVMQLFLPLIVLTLLIIYFEAEVVWLLTKLQALFLALAAKLSSLLPGGQWLASHIANLLVLMGITFLPVLAINLWYRRETHEDFQYADLVLSLVWLFIALLLTTL